MSVSVNQELCTGCGACLDACSIGAIQLVDQRAVLTEALCTQCEACADVCPNGAITTITIPERSTDVAIAPTVEHSSVPSSYPLALPEKVTPAQGLASLTGAAMMYLSKEIAPRLVDVLISRLERRLVQPTTATIAPQNSSRQSVSAQGKRECKRACQRRGYANRKMHEERR